jgi:hypothetical protein
MTETETQPKLKGELEWSDGKSIHIQARFDKVAVHENRLMFISLVAFSQDIKAFRAALAAGLTCPIRLRNGTLMRHDERLASYDVWPSLAGYRVHAHRLGFGSIHAMFVCRQQGFLATDSDDALWQKLKQERFTTSVLRGWQPHIRKELELKSLFSRFHALDCTCAVLSATSDDLHAIVGAGIKDGSIAIQADAA